jgi:hypothetical protein
MASQAYQPGLSSVLAELQDLKQKVEELKQDQGTLSDNQLIQLKLINGLRDKETKSSAGTKTAARIAKLKSILKARGGSQTFQKLQEDLDLSPSEFTYLVGCLDKRSFEVSRRPGSKRGEKVLSLRVRIMEPIVFK